MKALRESIMDDDEEIDKKLGKTFQVYKRKKATVKGTAFAYYICISPKHIDELKDLLDCNGYSKSFTDNIFREIKRNLSSYTKYVYVRPRMRRELDNSDSSKGGISYLARTYREEEYQPTFKSTEYKITSLEFNLDTWKRNRWFPDDDPFS